MDRRTAGGATLSALAAAAVVIAAAATTAPGARAASFTGIGDLPGGNISSGAHAVSGDGTTVVGRSASASGNNEAFRWTQASGMVGLGDLPQGGFSSQAHGVSFDGSVVVGQAAGVSGLEAFRWTSAGMVGIGALPGGSFASTARGVSADGSVVVGFDASANGAQEAFRWTQASGLVPLGDLAGGAFYSEAYGVSADGTTVVGLSMSGSGQEAFRWTQATGITPLGDLAGGTFRSDAYAVSADGSVVVGLGTSASGQEAFRWVLGGGPGGSDLMVGLGDLAGGGFGSAALALSADGSVVVGRGTGASNGNEAFIWDAANGMRRLQSVLATDLGLAAALSGWTLTEATGISADGRVVVGIGTNALGQTEAWRAELFDPVAIPEPGTLALAALGLGALGARAARRGGPGAS